MAINPQLKRDAHIQIIKNYKAKVEIEIIKYNNGKGTADQIKQKHADMCKQVNHYVDKFEKEYESYPTHVLEVMKEADKAMRNIEMLINNTIGE